jgi:hypothetical protein
MGITLYIALDVVVDGIQIDRDRVYLAKLVGDAPTMGELCGTLGVKSLSEFQSYDPELLVEFIDDPGDLEAAIANAAPVRWFDPAEALLVVKALQLHFEEARLGLKHRGQPADRRRLEPFENLDELILDLQDLYQVLAIAENAGAKFRLYLSF